jgi:hypothetical protein
VSATQTPPPANDADGAHWLPRLVGRLQCNIPMRKGRKLALGFFIIDPPCEWGRRCIYYDGPNYYIAAGRLCFGWGVVYSPNGRDERQPTGE